MTPIQEIISRATIEGNILRLPEGQLDRKVYQAVADAIALIGGKWKGGKTMGFVFNTDPTAKVDILLSGEKIISAKKEYQYFATPRRIARDLVYIADIQPGDKICEPSVGQGAIAQEILAMAMGLGVKLDCFELMPENQAIFNDLFEASIDRGQVRLLGADFLTEIPEGQRWNKIIANPPFSNNQDIDHVRKMYEHLEPKGILVSIMSPHWTFASEKKCIEFREWLDGLGADVQELDPGTFKEAGTNIRTMLVSIAKAGAVATHPKHQVGPRIARFTEELRTAIEFDAKEDGKKAARKQGITFAAFARNAIKDAVKRHKEFMADKSPGARVFRKIMKGARR